jgi:hypothetical protein
MECFMSEIVPFGKYKGQPIESMAEDRQYVEWLTTQPWFRQQHRTLYTIVINNFCQPSETPEHNAMQALFLEPDYRKRFLMAAVLGGARGILERRFDYCAEMARFAEIRIDVGLEEVAKDCKMLRDDGYSTQINPDESETSISISFRNQEGHTGGITVFETRLIRVSEPIFEESGCDVSFRAICGFRCDVGASTEIRCELKPQIGDDYPAVLREMKRSNARFLLVGEYTGVGVDRETFLKFFRSQGIFVAFQSGVEKISSGRFPVISKELLLEKIRAALT